MTRKGEKLKWNTPKGVQRENIEKSISGEKDSRGRPAVARITDEQQAANESRTLARIKAARKRRAKPR
jgi:hypothetical protein